MYPSGHEQTAWWFITWQFAVGAHGLLYAHGLIQSLFSHAVWSGHSSLFAQPAANVASVDGVTVRKKHHAYYKFHNQAFKKVQKL